MADPSIKPTVRGKKWPADFTNRGHVRPERVPKGTAIWVRIDNTYYYATLDGWYVGHGTGPVPCKAWLQGQRPGREFPRQRWHLPAVLPLHPREQRNKRQFYENYPNQFTTTSSEPSTRRIAVGRIARLARGEISIDCELANREKVTQLVKAAKALQSQINALRSWTSVG